jgi:hypothetical protein
MRALLTIRLHIGSILSDFNLMMPATLQPRRKVSAITSKTGVVRIRGPEESPAIAKLPPAPLSAPALDDTPSAHHFT